MTKRMTLWVQVATEICFDRLAWLTLRDKMRSSDNLEDLRESIVLLFINRSHLRWIVHLLRMHSCWCPMENAFLLACLTQTRICWMDYIFSMVWEYLGILPRKSRRSGEDMDIWATYFNPPVDMAYCSSRPRHVAQIYSSQATSYMLTCRRHYGAGVHGWGEGLLDITFLGLLGENGWMARALEQTDWDVKTKQYHIAIWF